MAARTASLLLLVPLAAALPLPPRGYKIIDSCSSNDAIRPTGAGLYAGCQQTQGSDNPDWLVSYSLSNPSRDSLSVWVSYDNNCDTFPPSFSAPTGTFRSNSNANINASYVSCKGMRNKCCVMVQCVNLVALCTSEILAVNYYYAIPSTGTGSSSLSPGQVNVIVGVIISLVGIILGWIYRGAIKTCRLCGCCGGGSRRGYVAGGAPTIVYTSSSASSSEVTVTGSGGSTVKVTSPLQQAQAPYPPSPYGAPGQPQPQPQPVGVGGGSYFGLGHQPGGQGQAQAPPQPYPPQPGYGYPPAPGQQGGYPPASPQQQGQGAYPPMPYPAQAPYPPSQPGNPYA